MKAMVLVNMRLNISGIGLVSLLFCLSIIGSAGAQCIDYEDNIYLLGGVETPDAAFGVVISGSYAYVADRYSGLQVIDISNPASPQIVGSVNTTGHAIDVAVSGSYAYVADNRGFKVIDISNPTSPQIVGRLTANILNAVGVAVLGSYAYVADWYYGLRVIDISNPVSPQLVGSAEAQGSASGVAVSGSFAYVAGEFWGLQVFDISNPVSPQLVASKKTSSSATSVAILGGYAYVADGWRGLKVVDISNPVHPWIAGSVATSNWAGGVAALDSYAYIANDQDGLQRIDISDPANPQLAGSADTPYNATAVAISGSYAYVADLYSGIQVISLPCGELPPLDLDILPSSDENKINCRREHGMLPVAVLGTPEFDVESLDHTTVRFGPGMAAEAHTKPKNKKLDSQLVWVKRHQEDIDGDGDLDLIFHFRLADTGLQCGDTEATLTGETYDGQAVTGTDVIQTHRPGSAVVGLAKDASISPNPFNPATTISFSTAQPQRVRIGVYDIKGRRVTLLVDQKFGLGEHSVEWQGWDSGGRVVSSGQYFFRVEIGNEVQIKKALLLK